MSSTSNIDEQALYDLLFDAEYNFDPEDEPDDPDDPDYYQPILENHEDVEFEPEANDTSARQLSKPTRYMGKGGTEWKVEPIIKPGRSAKFSQKIYVPGPQKNAKEQNTPFEHWKLLIDEEIMETILLHTSQEMNDRSKKRVELGYAEQSYHENITK